MPARWVLLLLVAGCGGQRVTEMRAVTPRGAEAEVSRVIEYALEADARTEAADSLYAPYAVIIAEGRIRRSAPRYAGVGSGGEVAITSSQLEIRSTAAWGDAEYRWVSNLANRVRVGRASFVVTPAQGREGWWIVQAHSSEAR